MKRKYGTQEERREGARTKLIEATIQLIAEQGLLGFSLSDVGRRAGVSRALPGHHFNSRAEMVQAAVGRIFDTGPPPSEFGLQPMLEAVKTRLTAAAAQDAASLALAQLVAGPLPANLAALREQYRQRQLALVTRHLNNAVAGGQVRNDLDPAAIAPVLLSQIHAEIVRLGVDRGSSDAFLDLMMCAVASAPSARKTRSA